MFGLHTEFFIVVLPRVPCFSPGRLFRSQLITYGTNSLTRNELTIMNFSLWKDKKSAASDFNRCIAWYSPCWACPSTQWLFYPIFKTISTIQHFDSSWQKTIGALLPKVLNLNSKGKIQSGFVLFCFFLKSGQHIHICSCCTKWHMSSQQIASQVGSRYLFHSNDEEGYKYIAWKSEVVKQCSGSSFLIGLAPENLQCHPDH